MGNFSNAAISDSVKLQIVRQNIFPTLSGNLLVDKGLLFLRYICHNVVLFGSDAFDKLATISFTTT